VLIDGARHDQGRVIFTIFIFAFRLNDFDDATAHFDPRCDRENRQDAKRYKISQTVEP
jgi:hypothetical protein